MEKEKKQHEFDTWPDCSVKGGRELLKNDIKIGIKENQESETKGLQVKGILEEIMRVKERKTDLD